MIEDCQIEPASDAAAVVRAAAGEWQEFVESRCDATAFHHSHWLTLLSRQYGLPLQVLVQKHGGEIRAGIPFLATKSLRGRRKLISLPFTDSVRALATDPESLASLRDGLQAMDFRPYTCVVMKSDRPLGFHTSESGVVRHEIDLTRPLEQIEATYANSLRRNVKKARRAGLSFEIRNDSEALSAFYTLHVKTRCKLGIPVQPRSFFDRFYETMVSKGLGIIGLVMSQGVPIAGVVLLTYQRSMIYKYAASDPSALQYRPNDLLVYHAIRHAVELGCDSFDFGTSRQVEEGLRRFKSKWGAVESTVYNDCLVGNLQPDRADTRAMTCARAAIRRSTILCRLLGEVLYRYSQ